MYVPGGTFMELSQKLLNFEFTQQESWDQVTSFVNKLEEHLYFEKEISNLYETLIHQLPMKFPKDCYFVAQKIKIFQQQRLKHLRLVSELVSLLGSQCRLRWYWNEFIKENFLRAKSLIEGPNLDLSEKMETVYHLELIDNASWDILIEMAEINGQGELAIKFQKAFDEQSLYMNTLKNWVRELFIYGRVINP
jgi:hypothetical protein